MTEKHQRQSTYFQDAGYSEDMIFAYKGDNNIIKGAHLVLLRDNGTATPVFTVCSEFTDNFVSRRFTGLPIPVHISEVRPVNYPYMQGNQGGKDMAEMDVEKEHMRTCLILAMELLERLPDVDVRPDQQMLRESLNTMNPWQHMDDEYQGDE